MGPSGISPGVSIQDPPHPRSQAWGEGGPPAGRPDPSTGRRSLPASTARHAVPLGPRPRLACHLPPPGTGLRASCGASAPGPGNAWPVARLVVVAYGPPTPRRRGSGRASPGSVHGAVLRRSVAPLRLSGAHPRGRGGIAHVLARGPLAHLAHRSGMGPRPRFPPGQEREPWATPSPRRRPSYSAARPRRRRPQGSRWEAVSPLAAPWPLPKPWSRRSAAGRAPVASLAGAHDRGRRGQAAVPPVAVRQAGGSSRRGPGARPACRWGGGPTLPRRLTRWRPSPRRW